MHLAFQGDSDPASIRNNMLTMEWPPHSRKIKQFPEMDRAGFFGIEEAKIKINPAQVPFLEKLAGSI